MAVASNDRDIISGINITPLVDIFLVLLIIFMITSTVIDQREINISLPKAAHAGTQAPKAADLVIDRDKYIFLDGVPSDSGRLVFDLAQALRARPDYEVLITADQDLAYKEVVRVIDIVRGAGVTNYALKVVRNRS